MIILVIILVLSVGAHVMNFISVACDCYLMNFEDLIDSFLWPVLLPVALFRRFILKKQLTNRIKYDILNTELRKGNREERNSQVEDIRPNRQRQLSRMAVTICALQM